MSCIFPLSNKQTNNRYLSQPDTCSNAWEYLEQEDNCGFSKCGNIALRARILQQPVFLIIRCIVGQVLACNNAHTICYCFTPHNLTLLSLQWSCTKGHPTFLQPPHFEASTLQRSAFEWEVAIAWMCGHTATSANGAKHTRPCRMTDRHHLHYPHPRCLHLQFIREVL